MFTLAEKNMKIKNITLNCFLCICICMFMFMGPICGIIFFIFWFHLSLLLLLLIFILFPFELEEVFVYHSVISPRASVFHLKFFVSQHAIHHQFRSSIILNFLNNFPFSQSLEIWLPNKNPRT